MEKMKAEKRSIVSFKEDEEHVWLIGSSSFKGSADELKAMWSELEEANRSNDAKLSFSSWDRYKKLRSSFYTIKKSPCYPGYLCCTCPEGIKDAVCKHCLLLMESEKLIDPLSQTLEGRQKRGRKKKVGHALERG